MNVMDLYGRQNGLDPDADFRELETAAEEHADAEHAASQLEEMKKVLLAQLITGMDGKSVAAKEHAALADPRYADHVAKMTAARRRANIAKARLLHRRGLSDMRRTVEVSARRLAQ